MSPFLFVLSRQWVSIAGSADEDRRSSWLCESVKIRWPLKCHQQFEASLNCSPPEDSRKADGFQCSSSMLASAIEVHSISIAPQFQIDLRSLAAELGFATQRLCWLPDGGPGISGHCLGLPFLLELRACHNVLACVGGCPLSCS